MVYFGTVKNANSSLNLVVLSNTPTGSTENASVPTASSNPVSTVCAMVSSIIMSVIPAIPNLTRSGNMAAVSVSVGIISIKGYALNIHIRLLSILHRLLRSVVLPPSGIARKGGVCLVPMAVSPANLAMNAPNVVPVTLTIQSANDAARTVVTAFVLL